MNKLFYILFISIASLDFNHGFFFCKIAKSETINRFSNGFIERMKNDDKTNGDTLLPRKVYLIQGIEKQSRNKAQTDTLIKEKEFNTLLNENSLDTQSQAQNKVQLLLKMNFVEIGKEVARPDTPTKKDTLIVQNDNAGIKNNLVDEIVFDSSGRTPNKIKLVLKMNFVEIEKETIKSDSLTKKDRQKVMQDDEIVKSDLLDKSPPDTLELFPKKAKLLLKMNYIDIEKETAKPDLSIKNDSQKVEKDSDIVVTDIIDNKLIDTLEKKETARELFFSRSFEDAEKERKKAALKEAKKKNKRDKKAKKTRIKDTDKEKKAKEKNPKTSKKKKKSKEKPAKENLKTKKPRIGDIVETELQEKAKFYLSRAKMEIDKKNSKKAISYLNKSISLNPSYTDAYNLKGDIYSSMSIYEKALLQYKKASYLDPQNAQINYNAGNCFILMERYDMAIEEWSKAIENDSTYILAYAGRASLLMKDKKYQEAIEDYDRIFRLNKYFYVAYKGRGVAYLELGNFNKAILDFNNYLSYEPKDDFVLYKRGMAKLSDSEIFGGCVDLLSAAELGNKEAEKALKKYCEK